MPQKHPLQMRAKSSPKAKDWFRIENAHVDSDGADNQTTKVYIYDAIGDSFWEDSTPAGDFIKQISTITTPNIELHLNSPGGDIFDGVAIYNALKAHPAKVHVIVDALAASAASFIAQAGDQVTMTKAATMMIHDGSAMAWGDAAVMRQTADLLDKLSNTVAEIYADNAGQTVEFWRDLMIEETWYNSHEAVEVGLADDIGEDTKDDDETKAQNAWDLSVFNYAGRNAAPDPLQVRQRIANRLKEKAVANKPQNTTGDGGEPQETGSPQADPDAQTTEGNAGEAEAEREEQVNPASGPENPAGEPSQDPEPASDPENATQFAPVASASGAFTFSINGVQTSDARQVQAHIETLENFRSESVKAGKMAFVTQLAADNKIMAPQVAKLQTYVLSLTDEQYDAWKATWDDAPAHQMFGTMPGGSSNHDGPQSQGKEDAANKLEIARDTVMHHKRSGLTDEQIRETQSYKDLIALDPEFKL